MKNILLSLRNKKTYKQVVQEMISLCDHEGLILSLTDDKDLFIALYSNEKKRIEISKYLFEHCPNLFAIILSHELGHHFTTTWEDERAFDYYYLNIVSGSKPDIKTREILYNTEVKAWDKGKELLVSIPLFNDWESFEIFKLSSLDLYILSLFGENHEY